MLLVSHPTSNRQTIEDLDLGRVLEGDICGRFGLDVVDLNSGGKVTDWVNRWACIGKKFCMVRDVFPDKDHINSSPGL